MKKHALALTALLLCSAPAAAQTLEVGDAPWEALEPLKSKDRNYQQLSMIEWVEDMLRNKECEMPGQSAERFSITVPYAVYVNPNGEAERVVVKEMNCRPLESAVGSLLLARAKAGDFRKSKGPEPKWYGSEMLFSLK